MLFKLLCNDMGSEYEILIIYTKILWLFAVRLCWQCINWGWNCSFFLSETETFDQLFLRCSLVAVVGAYCWYFQKVAWVQPVIASTQHKHAHTAENKVAAVNLKFISWYQYLQQSKFVCFDKINDLLTYLLIYSLHGAESFLTS
jgi:hypothetical protein